MQQAIEFLSTILPQGPYTYCASCIGPDTNGKWRDTAHKTMESVVSYCYNRAKINNTYFALSAFQQGWHVNKNQKKVFRTQQNACYQKAFWLDVDCGKHDSPYDTADKGIEALSTFITITHLPIPTIVCSGTGLHIYWALTEAINTQQWTILAKLMKQLCLTHGFIADHSRTIDAASVLRLPGTFNIGKDGVARPVTLLYKGLENNPLEFAKLLLSITNNTTPVIETQSELIITNRPLPVPAGINFSDPNQAYTGPPRHPYRIIKECKQILTSGIGTYHQWYNMMTVMRHCMFGEQAIHDISKTDTTRYSPEVVDRQLQVVISEGYGPCRCIKFDEKTPDICPTCPYWGKIASPIVLGETYTEKKPVVIQQTGVYKAGETTTARVVPFTNKEFSVIPNKGIIWHKRTLVTGETLDPEEEGRHYITKDILICDTEIYIHSIFIDNTSTEFKRSYLVRKQAPGRSPEDILFDISSDYGTSTINKWFATHGMAPIHPKYNKQMSDFMSTYLAAIQNKLPEVYTRDTFGWVKNKDNASGIVYDGFIIGHHMLTPRGTTSVKLNERAADIANSYVSSGDLQQWLPIPQMYRILNQPYAMLMVLNAFSAPFMHFGIGTATNIAYSIWDIKGGKGKSTILEVGASVWGHPKLLLQTKGDTHASRFQKFSVQKHLPIFIDEITNITGASLSDLTYDIVNGREKSRSNSAGTGLTKSGTWATSTLFTSNRSLYEILQGFRVQSEATCMRIIEMQCDFPDYQGTEWGDYIQNNLKALATNYGLAGPTFIQYCLDNPSVIGEIQAKAQEYAKRFFSRSDERFWAYGIGIPLAVGEIVVRAGLLDYNIAWLADWCQQVLLPTIRSKVKAPAPNGDHLVTEYLNEHLGNTLVVDAPTRTKAQVDPQTQSGLDTYVKAYPTHGLYIRHELDTNTYYVSVKHFNKWCESGGLSIEVVLQDLVNKKIWKPENKFQYSLGRYVAAVNRSRSLVYKFIFPKEL